MRRKDCLSASGMNRWTEYHIRKFKCTIEVFPRLSSTYCSETFPALGRTLISYLVGITHIYVLYRTQLNYMYVSCFDNYLPKQTVIQGMEDEDVEVLRFPRDTDVSNHYQYEGLTFPNVLK